MDMREIITLSLTMCAPKSCFNVIYNMLPTSDVLFSITTMRIHMSPVTIKFLLMKFLLETMWLPRLQESGFLCFRSGKEGGYTENQNLHAGWRDVSEVESTDCSSRGLRFNSQHQNGSSQLPVISVSGDLTPSCM